MPEHIWSVLCYKGCLDQYTNTVSLLDVLESIRLKGPAPMPKSDQIVYVPLQMNVVSFWMRSDLTLPESCQVRSVLILPDGTEMPAKVISDANLQEHRRVRVFMGIPTIPLRGPGLYRFGVEYRTDASDEWARVAQIPLEVAIEEIEPQKPAASVSAPGARRARKRRPRAASRAK